MDPVTMALLMALGTGFMSSMGSGIGGKLMGGGGQAQVPQATYALAPPPTATAAQPMNLEALISQVLRSQAQGTVGGPMTPPPAPMMNFGQQSRFGS